MDTKVKYKKRKAVTQKEFELIKTLLSNGIKGSKVRDIMGFSKKSATVYIMNKFATLEEYLKYNRERQREITVKKKEAIRVSDSLYGITSKPPESSAPETKESIYPHLNRIEDALVTIAKLLNILITQTKDKKGWF